VRLTTWVQLMKTYLVLHKGVAACVAEHDMTIAQFDVMVSLSYGDGLTQQELASRLLVTKGNVCGLVDRLELAGWVERRVDHRDARVNRVFLTPSGRKKIESVVPHHDELIGKLLRSLSVGECSQLRGLLMRIERGVGEA
jgi:DNA-binding MarR family transcriptional regulator